jgi:hypothetical protein
MSLYFINHENYSTWPGLHDRKGKLHTLVSLTSIPSKIPTYTTKGRTAYIPEDHMKFETTALSLLPGIRPKILEKWGPL